jgi:hypothetical protein
MGRRGPHYQFRCYRRSWDLGPWGVNPDRGVARNIGPAAVAARDASRSGPRPTRGNTRYRSARTALTGLDLHRLDFFERVHCLISVPHGKLLSRAFPSAIGRSSPCSGELSNRGCSVTNHSPPALAWACSFATHPDQQPQDLTQHDCINLASADVWKRLCLGVREERSLNKGVC